MKIESKIILFTIIDMIILLLAFCWTFWLLVYFDQSISGSIYIESDYHIFERNYLVPLQIFGITVFSTIFSFKAYHQLRKKNLISKRYMILMILHTLPFWYISVMQIDQMISFKDIYS